MDSVLSSAAAGKQEFRPDNLIYTFDDKLSLSGLFLRMDNFLGQGTGTESMEKFGEKCRQEKAELATGTGRPGQEEVPPEGGAGASTRE